MSFWGQNMSEVSPGCWRQSQSPKFCVFKHRISTRHWTKFNWRSVAMLLQYVTKAFIRSAAVWGILFNFTHHAKSVSIFFPLKLYILACWEKNPPSPLNKSFQELNNTSPWNFKIKQQFRKITVFWYVTPYSVVRIYWVGVTWCWCLQGTSKICW